MTYCPRPIETDDIRLPPELEQVAERLAEHVHEVWAQGRIAEGWSFGPTRDDRAKTHPGLIAYAELSEEEKAYDRRTAMGTLRALIALGYRISRRTE